jgi:hypothetical protein
MSKNLPATVRNAVWNIYIGSDKKIGLCLCCGVENISFGNFHCGHVISRHNKGNNKINNLKPVCALCNNSMGRTNMSKFMDMYGFIKKKNWNNYKIYADNNKKSDSEKNNESSESSEDEKDNENCEDEKNSKDELIIKFINEACLKNKNDKLSSIYFYTVFRCWCNNNFIKQIPSRSNVDEHFNLNKFSGKYQYIHGYSFIKLPRKKIDLDD